MLNIAEKVANQISAKGINARADISVQNGVSCAVVELGNGQIKPRIEIADIVEKGLSIEAIAEEVIKRYEKSKAATKELSDSFHEFIMDFSQVRPRLRLVLVNERNIEDFTTRKVLFRKEFADLISYANIELGQTVDGGTHAVKVTQNLLDAWGATAEEVYKAAKANVLAETGYFNIYMHPVMMNVLSTEDHTLGAVAMLNKELIAAFGRDSYIIPSSIHELLLVPSNSNLNIWDLADTVISVNKTILNPKEFLSNNIYHFVDGEFVEALNSEGVI